MEHSPNDNPAVQALPTRRGFFAWLTYGLGALAALLVAVPFLGFLFGLRKRETKWKTLGKVSDFKVKETQLKKFENPIREPWDGEVAQTGVYVRYEGEDRTKTDLTERYKFLIFAVNCAHLGCPVSWFSQSGLFLCPCHGGVYYANGDRASGPPPRGLFRCRYRVLKDEKGVPYVEVQAPHYPTLQNPLDPKDTGGA
jgi:Rieske Fe-S protein